MGNQVKFCGKVLPVWNTIAEVRRIVDALFIGHERNFIDAILITTTELLENAVRHGHETGLKGEGIKFEMDVDNERICLSTTNQIRTTNDYDNLKNHVDKLNSSSKAKELYVERLRCLAQSATTEKVQLGLFRIVYECEFNLDYQLENDVLTVTAKRQLSPG
jgi:hypothetical protein